MLHTPCYVLLNGPQRTGPTLLPGDIAANYQVIYGFTDKPPYDLFCAASESRMTPYPLVRGYLRTQLAEAGEKILLIAIDPTGPNETELQAATMQAVMDAQEAQATEVPLTYRLIRDPAQQAYDVQPVGTTIDPERSPVTTS